MKSPSPSVVIAAALVFAGLTAVPSGAQDGEIPGVPAAEKPEKKNVKTLTQQKAEQILIPRLEFAEADLGECVSYLRKKSQDHDTDADPNKRGLSFLIRVPGSDAKPVTLSLKNVSVWEAARKIAASAGVEVSVGAQAIIVIHPKGAGPVAQPVAAEYTKSAVWQRAEKIVIDRARFSDSSAEDVCKFLNAKTGKGVVISAAEGLAGTVTMELRDVRLTDFITAVAEVLGAEITVAEEKIILKPAEKE